MTPGDGRCLGFGSLPKAKRIIKISAIGDGVQLFCTSLIDSHPVETLIDPGAGVSVVEKSAIKNIEPVQEDVELTTANGTLLPLVGQARVSLTIGTLKLDKILLVASGLPRKTFVLGNDILLPFNCSLKYKTQTLSLDGGGRIPFRFNGGNRVEALSAVQRLENCLKLLKLEYEKRRRDMEKRAEKVESPSPGFESRRMESHDKNKIRESQTPGGTTSPEESEVEWDSQGPGGIVSPRTPVLENGPGKVEKAKPKIAEDSYQSSTGSITGPEGRRPLKGQRSDTRGREASENGNSVGLAEFPEGFPCLVMTERKNKGKVPSVKVAETFCLPPLATDLVPVFYDLPEGDEENWLIINRPDLESRAKVFVVPGIVTKRVKMILLSNETEETQTIQKNQRIADLRPVQQEIEPESASIMSISKKPKLFDPSLFDICPDAKPEDKADLLKILEEFWDVFAVSNEELTGTNIVEHSINTGDHPPIRQRLWTRHSLAEDAIVEQQTREMLELGIIERAYSPWACNVVLAKKPGGGTRYCCDFRALNQVTEFMSYPMPRINDVLDSFSGSTVFSPMDLMSGYWQIKMCRSDGSYLKTAFITKFGSYVWDRLPFGLKNAPQEFQCLMDRLFWDMRQEIANYLDDVTPHGKDVPQHNARLRKVLERLRAANLKVKISKCKFLYNVIRYLGFVVSKDGIAPDPKKVEGIQKMPQPQTLTQLRSFMGMVNFYKRFIEKLAFVAKPLHNLMSEERFRAAWNVEEVEAFDLIKQALSREITLSYFRPSLPTEIHCDACGYAVAGVLLQVEEKLTRTGKRRRVEVPIQFVSRTLHEPERKWDIGEKEMLALIFCLKEFRPYIALQKFTIRTDRLSLVYLKNAKDPIKTRIARWAMQLNEFECEVVFKPGKTNVVADALSRNPVPNPLDVQATEEMPMFSLAGGPGKLLNPKCPGGLELEEPGEELVKMDWAYFQMMDDYCVDRMTHIEDDPRFSLVNDILVKTGDEMKYGRDRIVVPLTLRATIIDVYHSNVVSAHLGHLKTTEKIRARFFWPGMKDQIKAYINKCLGCKRHKITPKVKVGKLKPIDPFEELKGAQSPGVFYSTDILGPFSLSESGNRVVIVVTDVLTRYVITGALPNGTAKEVARFLVDRVICVYGGFKFLLSDNGTCYRSKLLKELARILSFKQKFTAPYSPQCNGLTERFNSTLPQMLRPFLEGTTYSNWDVHIPAVTFAYNTSIQASTRMKPYRLMFGREPILPMDITLRLPSPSLAAESMAEALDFTMTKVQENLNKAQAKQKEYFDAGRRVQACKPGDLVIYDVPTIKPGVAKKLLPKGKGPYEIVKRINDLVYVIKPEGEEDLKHMVVSARRLRPFELVEIQGSNMKETKEPLSVEKENQQNPLTLNPQPEMQPKIPENSVGSNVKPSVRSSARLRQRADAGIPPRNYKEMLDF